jgi:hypothetical protein
MMDSDVRVCTPSQGAPPPARRFFISQPYCSSLTLLILLAIGSRTAAADADYPLVMWVDAVGGTDDDPCGSGGPESPCKSIQFALHLFPSWYSMTSNATIHVAAGKYTVPSSGGIDFEGRPVMIVGEKGKTVVDCDGAAEGFVAQKNEPSTAVTNECSPLPARLVGGG